MTMKGIYLRNLGFAIVVWSAATVSGAKADDCSGSPKDAVMALPAPLASWAVIVCTPYGHIISSKTGWIWSYPGAYSPVFIPSQMVQSNPAPVGNQSYFSEIAMNKIIGNEAKVAYDEFHAIFGPESRMPDEYRLELTSSSGRTLQLNFFDYGTYASSGVPRKMRSKHAIYDIGHGPPASIMSATVRRLLAIHPTVASLPSGPGKSRLAFGDRRSRLRP